MNKPSAMLEGEVTSIFYQDSDGDLLVYRTAEGPNGTAEAGSPPEPGDVVMSEADWNAEWDARAAAHEGHAASEVAAAVAAKQAAIQEGVNTLLGLGLSPEAVAALTGQHGSSVAGVPAQHDHPEYVGPDHPHTHPHQGQSGGSHTHGDDD